jgi:hypothetical protein
MQHFWVIFRWRLHEATDVLRTYRRTGTLAAFIIFAVVGISVVVVHLARPAETSARCAAASRQLALAPTTPTKLWTSLAAPVAAVAAACPNHGADPLHRYAERIRGNHPMTYAAAPTAHCSALLDAATAALTHSDDPAPYVNAATAECPTDILTAVWQRNVAAWVEQQAHPSGAVSPSRTAATTKR